MIKIDKDKHQIYQRYIAYGIVGVCTTGVSYTSYFILYSRGGLNANLANIISIILAVLFAYVANKIFVFKSKCLNLKMVWIEFIKFISSRLVTMVIEVLGVFLLLKCHLLGEMWAKIFTSIVVVILNYAMSHFFVFNSKNANK